MTHPSARTVRNWYRLHKWSSLICTAFLLMACITGLPLVFQDELDAWLQPHVAPPECRRALQRPASIP